MKDAVEQARRAGLAGRGKSRTKGQGHPATADIVYTPREWEFMLAIDRFKRSSGRQFPTLADVLRIVDQLGYTQPWRDAQWVNPKPQDLLCTHEDPDRPIRPPGS